ncbi:hypothetical protein TURU_002370 [Turdus rufiventris]|nr:hypothetical protein TURU_002370 [Turdus rufiventris]
MNSTLEADQVFLSALSQLRTLQIANTHQLQLRAELAEAVEALLSKKRMLAEILIRVTSDSKEIGNSLATGLVPIFRSSHCSFEAANS